MYKMGDYVVYGLLRVCKVEGIETPSFESDSTKKYYKLLPAFEDKSNTVIFVPTDAENSLRSVRDETEIRKLFNELPKIRPTVCPFKKPPQVTSFYQAILTNCDLREYLGMLKEFYAKEKAGIKKMSEIDGRFQRKVEQLLCDEFAVALGSNPAEIQEKLRKSL